MPPVRLKAVDTPTDGQIPSYQASSGEFEWVDDSSGGTPGGSDTQVQFNDGGSFGGDNGFTYTKATEKVKVGNASIVTSNAGKVSVVQESADTGAALYLQKDEDGAGSGPNLVFYRNSASPAINDELGRIGFNGEDAVGGERTYARITGVIENKGAGSPDGRIVFETIEGGTQTEQMRIDSGGIKFNEAYTFPTADGNANQVLTTDGAGAVTFEDAGGGAFNLELLPPDFDGSTEEYQIASATPPGTNDVQGQYQTQSGWLLYPFVAAKSGSLASMAVYVAATGGTTTGTIDVGIYTDSDGVPNSLLGYAQFDPTTTGTKTDTSLSATISLTRGSQYWISWFKNGTNNNPSLYAAEYDNGGGTGISANVFSQGSPTIKDESTISPTSFPSSVTASNLNSAGGFPKLMVGLKWA